MADKPDEIKFQRCRTIVGAIRCVGTYRRNGKTVLNLGPTWTSPSDFSEPEARDGHVRSRAIPDDLFANLTEVEERTWRMILKGYSPADIAKEERVTRPAIYERIRGNTKGQGGMVSKNRWVARWWNLRKNLRRNGSND